MYKKLSNLPVERLDMAQAHSLLAFTQSLEKAMVKRGELEFED